MVALKGLHQNCCRTVSLGGPWNILTSHFNHDELVPEVDDNSFIEMPGYLVDFFFFFFFRGSRDLRTIDLHLVKTLILKCPRAYEVKINKLHNDILYFKVTKKIKLLVNSSNCTYSLSTKSRHSFFILPKQKISVWLVEYIVNSLMTAVLFTYQMFCLQKIKSYLAIRDTGNLKLKTCLSIDSDSSSVGKSKEPLWTICKLSEVYRIKASTDWVYLFRNILSTRLGFLPKCFCTE